MIFVFFNYIDKIYLLFYSSQIKLSKFRLTNLDNRDDSADSEYWLKYENLIDDKKEKLWDAMLYALQNYQYVFLVIQYLKNES